MSRPKTPNPRKVRSIRLSAAEWDQLQEIARMHYGMTTTEFIRNIALGHKPPDTMDAELIRLMTVANQNFTRSGNLLKMWLAGKTPEQGVDVKALAADLKATGDRLFQTAVEVCQKL